jgi:MFS family permease
MPWFLLYCLVVIIGAFACLGRSSGPLPRRFWLLLCACLGYLAVAVFAVQAPQCGFRHYSFLLLHPVALLLGGCAAQVVGLLADGVNRGLRLRAKVAAVWVSAATAGLIAVHVCGYVIHIRLEKPSSLILVREPGNWRVPFLPIPPREVFPVAEFIARHARPGDCMSVWGWAAHYYVYAGVPDATRDLTTGEAMPPTPWTAGMGEVTRGYYRQRYLADLRRAMPAFFVDAVSSSELQFTDRQRDGHETWPDLAAFVADNYVKVFENKVGPEDGTRVYLLKARLAREPLDR